MRYHATVSGLAEILHRVEPARAGPPPHPGLLLLHGRGADERDLPELLSHLDPRLLGISLRAPFDWPGGGYCWYQLAGPGQPETPTFRESLARLQAVLADLPARYPVDPSRLFLLGFSQGSVMATSLLVTEPHRVAGALLLSGFSPPEGKFAIAREAVRGKPAFVAHGTRDPVIDVRQGRAVRAWLEGLGLDLTYREYEMGHQVSGPELRDADAWLREQLDRPAAGPRPHDPA